MEGFEPDEVELFAKVCIDSLEGLNLDLARDMVLAILEDWRSAKKEASA